MLLTVPKLAKFCWKKSVAVARAELQTGYDQFRADKEMISNGFWVLCWAEEASPRLASSADWFPRSPLSVYRNYRAAKGDRMKQYWIFRLRKPTSASGSESIPPLLLWHKYIFSHKFHETLRHNGALACFDYQHYLAEALSRPQAVSDLRQSSA